MVDRAWNGGDGRGVGGDRLFDSGEAGQDFVRPGALVELVLIGGHIAFRAKFCWRVLFLRSPVWRRELTPRPRLGRNLGGLAVILTF